ncbi:MAG: hypothetical protein RLZZ303_131 [Candidatus Hydrogenedentota bacterium]|jgi:uncharacterized protein YggE
MRTPKYCRALIALCLLTATAAWAQPEPEPPALAQSIGRATVTQPAATLAIAVERVFEGESFAALWPEAAAFRSGLASELAKLSSQPNLRLTVSVEQTGPARIAARGAVLINLGPFSGLPEADVIIATAMDEVIALCRDAQAKTGGVSYELGDDAGLRQEAIRKATEEAFLPADAIAAALRSELFNVDQVRVKSIEVGSGPGPDAPSNSATAREVYCTAEVEVTYLLSDAR